MLSLCKANVLYHVPKLLGAGIWIGLNIIFYHLLEFCCLKVSL